ncbi:MAG: class D sortase [Anaerolineae bacterium]|nr:MAG: class D sortase [Anaerolineae bacterium]
MVWGIISAVKKARRPEDLSVEELRRLLVEKRRADRRARLEHFRKTGRVVSIADDFPAPAVEPSRPLGDLPVVDDALPQAPRRQKNVLDGFLLLIELAAVIGLVFILFNGVTLMNTLNQEVASALVQPSPTPTPLVVAVVLPSGHTPPTDPGGARPNEAEIPEHLRPLVQSLSNVPLPTPGPEQAIRIQIPALNVDAPVVQGDGWEQLKKGVGQHIGSANPGEKGNVVLSAHNDIFGEIFRYLDKLKPGDEIILYTNQRAYRYMVTRTRVVEPTEVSVMQPTQRPTVTLISCYPYLVDNQRIVVSAELQQ